MALTLAASMLTSCSYFTSFVVENRSAGPATVTWTFVTPQGTDGRSHCPLTEAGYVATTGVITHSRLWGDRFEGRGQASGLRIEAESCQATATLGPGSTLRVHEELNFVASSSTDQQMLDRLRIEVRGAPGTLTVEPGQALQRFTCSGDMLYQLPYR